LTVGEELAIAGAWVLASADFVGFAVGLVAAGDGVALVAVASAFALLAFGTWIIIAVCVTVASDILAFVGVDVASFVVATVGVVTAFLEDADVDFACAVAVGASFKTEFSIFTFFFTHGVAPAVDALARVGVGAVAKLVGIAVVGGTAFFFDAIVTFAHPG